MLQYPKVTPKILRRPFVRKRWVCGACAVGTSHIYCAPPPPIALLHWLVRGKAGALTASHQRKVAERRRGKKGGKKVVVRRRKSAFATASQEGGGEERSLCPGLPAKSQQKKTALGFALRSLRAPPSKPRQAGRASVFFLSLSPSIFSVACLALAFRQSESTKCVRFMSSLCRCCECVKKEKKTSKTLHRSGGQAGGGRGK